MCCALISGCAVNAPPVLRSDNGLSRDISRIHLITPEENQPQRIALHDALSDALGAKGIEVSDDANTIGEVAIAGSPSTVGLYAGEAGASDDNARPIAQIRKSRWYDGCKASRMKASLAVFDRTSGDLITRSEVESVTCEGDPMPMAEIAELLVDEVTGS